MLFRVLGIALLVLICVAWQLEMVKEGAYIYSSVSPYMKLFLFIVLLISFLTASGQSIAEVKAILETKRLIGLVKQKTGIIKYCNGAFISRKNVNEVVSNFVF